MCGEPVTAPRKTVRSAATHSARRRGERGRRRGPRGGRGGVRPGRVPPRAVSRVARRGDVIARRGRRSRRGTGRRCGRRRAFRRRDIPATSRRGARVAHPARRHAALLVRWREGGAARGKPGRGQRTGARKVARKHWPTSPGPPLDGTGRSEFPGIREREHARTSDGSRRARGRHGPHGGGLQTGTTHLWADRGAIHDIHARAGTTSRGCGLPARTRRGTCRPGLGGDPGTHARPALRGGVRAP